MKKKLITIVILAIIFILVSTTIFSIVKFNVWNPFSSCFGMLEILFTNKKYTIVQKFPSKVGFSKTGDTSEKSAGEYLDEYMINRGFYFVPEKQMGAELVYSNGTTEEHVIFSANKYYSRWIWQ